MCRVGWGVLEQFWYISSCPAKGLSYTRDTNTLLGSTNLWGFGHTTVIFSNLLLWAWHTPKNVHFFTSHRKRKGQMWTCKIWSYVRSPFKGPCMLVVDTIADPYTDGKVPTSKNNLAMPGTEKCSHLPHRGVFLKFWGSTLIFHIVHH